MHVAHPMQRMHTGCMSDDFTSLELIDPDDGSWPTPPPAITPGHVDVTSRLADGSTWRVATTTEQVLLTIAGPDGMATLRLAGGDTRVLINVLKASDDDLRQIRMGRPW